MDFVLRGASVVSAVGINKADVAVSQGRIVAVGAALGRFAQEFDCEGLFVVPGAIDMHVHLREPGLSHKEDFETGTAAAAAGGVTTVMEMPNTLPPVTNAAALAEKREIASGRASVNYGFFFGATEDNLEEIQKAENVVGVKICLAETTGGLTVRKEETLEKLFQLKKLIVVHAEDAAIIEENQKRYAGAHHVSSHGLIRSPEAALAATKRALHLAKKYGTRLHLTHITTAAEVTELQKCKTKMISADATPHHLFLTDDIYKKLSSFAKVNPPLRTEADRIALFNALRRGVVDAVATDHAPHTFEEKNCAYPQAAAGLPGLETMLPVLLDAVNHGLLGFEEVVRAVCENPATILGLAQKGRIAEGFDADICVVDMSARTAVGSRRYFSKSGWSPFDGWVLQGWPMMTFVGGELVFDKGQLVRKACGREVQFTFA